MYEDRVSPINIASEFPMNSKEMGSQAEEKFAQCMRAAGYSLVKASRQQDMIEHWDFLVSGKNGKSIKVEVKSRKRLNRSDSDVNDNIVYVEFKNVNGDNGWLYGKADYVAFERPTCFIFVELVALQKLAEKLVEDTWTNSPTLHKKYHRRDRPKECVSLLTFREIVDNIEVYRVDFPSC